MTISPLFGGIPLTAKFLQKRGTNGRWKSSRTAIPSRSRSGRARQPDRQSRILELSEAQREAAEEKPNYMALLAEKIKPVYAEYMAKFDEQAQKAAMFYLQGYGSPVRGEAPATAKIAFNYLFMLIALEKDEDTIQSARRLLYNVMEHDGDILFYDELRGSVRENGKRGAPIIATGINKAIKNAMAALHDRDIQKVAILADQEIRASIAAKREKQRAEREVEPSLPDAEI